jgi:poly(hydroxyalkanoate) depolymerase family esterase
MNRILLVIVGLSFFCTCAWSKKTTFLSFGRNFTLVSPDTFSTQSRPLLVLLHGCKQSSEIIIDGTNMESEAMKNNFHVLAPEQSLLFNMDHCWNWFLKSEQERMFPGNELSQIMLTVEGLIRTQNINRDRVFLAGMSAGGVMAHNLSVCYPDYFKGVAVHSGLAYKVAEGLSEANSVLTNVIQKSPEYMGKHAAQCAPTFNHGRLSKFMIIHGTLDERVRALHATQVSATNEVWWDYNDDGKRNDSLAYDVSTSTTSFPNNYTVRAMDRFYPSLDLTERTLIVKGLAHAWGSSNPISVNFDDKAPSSTDAILKFFNLKQ